MWGGTAAPQERTVEVGHSVCDGRKQIPSTLYCAGARDKASQNISIDPTRGRFARPGVRMTKVVNPLQPWEKERVSKTNLYCCSRIRV